MQYHHFRSKSVYSVLCAAMVAVLVATSASATVYPTDKKHLTGPLSICDEGSFFVGGVPKLTQYANSPTATAYQELIIGQMYVQFQRPAGTKKWPLVMVHGGGYSGSCVESTPDGREGWYPYAVRHKLSTFVVDQAGRGRSGWDRSFVNEAIATNNFVGFPSLGNTSASGIWTAWFGHIINGPDIITGTMIRHGDPGDPTCVGTPSHCNYHTTNVIPPVPNAVDPDIEARVGAIGPAPNPANNTYLALEHYKHGVPNTDVTLPRLGCTTCNPTNPAAADIWSGRDLATLVEGLKGAVVATHSQSGSVGHHLVRYLKADDAVGKCGAPGACLAMLKGLITIDGVCSFAASGTTAADYHNIPYLAFRGWYGPSISGSCDGTVAAIKAAGGTADFIKLDDPSFGTKFQGTTHMMMMATNSIDVIDVILDWTGKNIPNPLAGSNNVCGNAFLPPN